MSTTGVFQASAANIELILSGWGAFQQSYPDQIKNGELTRAMVCSAAGMPGQAVEFHYGVGRRLMLADERACGAMIVFNNSVSTQIEWLGVIQDWRRSGMASNLIDEEKAKILSPVNRRNSLTAELRESPNGMTLEAQVAFWRAMDFDICPVIGSENKKIIAIFEAD